MLKEKQVVSNVDRILEYFRRQYETEEGSVEENFNALFAEDAVFHIGEGKTIAREAIIQAAHGLRNVPERHVEILDIKEQGDEVGFHTRTRAQDVETGEPAEFENHTVWRFNAQGMVVESFPQQPDDAVGRLRSLGADV
jgi:hypothetical protein